MTALVHGVTKSQTRLSDFHFQVKSNAVEESICGFRNSIQYCKVINLQLKEINLLKKRNSKDTSRDKQYDDSWWRGQVEKAFALPSADGILNTAENVCVCVCVCLCVREREWVNQMEMKQRNAIKDRKPVTPSSLTYSLEQVSFRSWELSQKSL